MPDYYLTQPISSQEAKKDELYRHAFIQDHIKQGERFDELTKILFSIELSALSAYILLLNFILKSSAIKIEAIMTMVGATVSLWFLALILTLISFFPKKYAVMEVIKREEPKCEDSEKLTIPEYYDAIAQYKRRYSLWAIISFISGLGILLLMLLKIYV